MMHDKKIRSMYTTSLKAKRTTVTGLQSRNNLSVFIQTNLNQNVISLACFMFVRKTERCWFTMMMIFRINKMYIVILLLLHKPCKEYIWLIVSTIFYTQFWTKISWFIYTWNFCGQTNLTSVMALIFDIKRN